MKVVVITGKVLPGFEATAVWTALAAMYGVGLKDFQEKVLTRTPVVLTKFDGEEAEEQLRKRLKDAGAEIRVYPEDDSRWEYLHEQRMRGPVPIAFLQDDFSVGSLAGATRVLKSGTNNWLNLGDVLKDCFADDTASSGGSALESPEELLQSDLLTPAIGEGAGRSPHSMGAPHHANNTPMNPILKTILVFFIVVLMVNLLGGFEYLLRGGPFFDKQSSASPSAAKESSDTSADSSSNKTTKPSEANDPANADSASQAVDNIIRTPFVQLCAKQLSNRASMLGDQNPISVYENICACVWYQHRVENIPNTSERDYNTSSHVSADLGYCIDKY